MFVWFLAPMGECFLCVVVVVPFTVLHIATISLISALHSKWIVFKKNTKRTCVHTVVFESALTSYLCFSVSAEVVI